MRYPPLLIALFLAMLLGPFYGHFTSFNVVNDVVLLMIFLTVIYAFRHLRRLAVGLTALTLISLTARFAARHWGLPVFQLISQGSNFVAMVLVMIAILSEVLRVRKASSDLVIGAVCLYFIIGMAWTFLYYSMYLLAPGSFFVSPAAKSVTTIESKFIEILYFSLSALTSIGSSGEEAVTVVARRLAVLECAMGQLHLAVLISRLVGFSTTSDNR